MDRPTPHISYAAHQVALFVLHGECVEPTRLKDVDLKTRGALISRRTARLSITLAPRHHPAVDSFVSVMSDGHFDTFRPPLGQQGLHSRASSMPGRFYPFSRKALLTSVVDTYLPRPANDSRSPQHPPDYTYDSVSGQWSNGPTPVALQSQSAYPLPVDTGTQFRHTTTEEHAPPSTNVVATGHFQPQLEPLVNPDGSPPFTHFRSSSGTDIANITGASRESSCSL